MQEFFSKAAKSLLYWFDEPSGSWVRYCSQKEKFYSVKNNVIHHNSKNSEINFWDTVLDESRSPLVRWFSGGKTNACFNEVDRHVLEGRGDKVAFIHEKEAWSSNNSLEKGTPSHCKHYTYKELLLSTVKKSLMFSRLDLKKSDSITIYMPNDYDQVSTIQAAKRMGIIYTPVFGGFSAKTIAERVVDTGSKLLVTSLESTKDGSRFDFLFDHCFKALENYYSVEKLINFLESLKVSSFELKEISILNDEKVIDSDQVLFVLNRLSVKLDLSAVLSQINIDVSNLLVFGDENTISDDKKEVLEKSPLASKVIFADQMNQTISEHIWSHSRFSEVEYIKEHFDSEIVSLSAEKFYDLLNSLCPVVPVESSYPLFVIYTSGSTGKPKGIVHSHGGYSLGQMLTMESSFGVSYGGSDKIFALADPGWITGQSYLISAPLLMGITSIIYEGSPVYPFAGRFASILDRHKVTIFKSGSTFLKMIQSVPSFVRSVNAFNFDSLKVATFCAEPTNPEVQKFAQECITSRYINSYWSTEHGGIIFTFEWDRCTNDLKPDAHCTPLPWIRTEVRKHIDVSGDFDGKNFTKAKSGEIGEIVITSPYPYMMFTIWGNRENVGSADWEGDRERLIRTYHSRWKGEGEKFQYTQGDNSSWYDDGSFMFHGRSDEVINVQGHRIGTEEIESAILKDIDCNPDSKIGNVIVVGLKDDVQGEVPLALVKLKTEGQLSNDDKKRLNHLIESEKSSYAVPIDYLEVEDFPETRSGKYLRRVVKRIISGEETGDVSTLKNPESIKELRAKIEQWKVAKGEFPKKKVNQKKISKSQLQNYLLETFGQFTSLPENFNKKEVVVTSFKDLGLKSINVIPYLVEITECLNNMGIQLNLEPTDFFNTPTIDLLANEVLSRLEGSLTDERIEKNEAASIKYGTKENQEIAIIGVSGQFPGGEGGLFDFWRTLRDQINPISDSPSDRYDVLRYCSQDRNVQGTSYTTWGGFLENYSNFDHQFFGISKREAMALDPQHRLLLQNAYWAIESALLKKKDLDGSNTSVFIGITSKEFEEVVKNSDDFKELERYLSTGNNLNTASGRISYSFNLKGPSISIDTACSSSLVAVHQAIQSLRLGESEMAIAAGVNLIQGSSFSSSLSKTGALSSTGSCKAFDQAADGYVRSEGCGVLILKPLEAAKRDGDTIFGIIKGSAVNQDGFSSGLTAPNGKSQSDLLSKALANSRLSSSDVEYIEAHGTGTPLGDPIEAQAIASVYDKVLIGSLKSNIGHTESCAGIAGIIKVLLSFQFNKIPGNLHFNHPNEKIPFEKYGIEVVDECIDWTSPPSQRVAGVSSFGFSGTNAHVVLQDYQSMHATPSEVEKLSRYLISAHSKKSLSSIVQQLEAMPQIFKSELDQLLSIHSEKRSDYRYRALVNKELIENSDRIEIVDSFSPKGSSLPFVSYEFPLAQISEVQNLLRAEVYSEMDQFLQNELIEVRHLEVNPLNSKLLGSLLISKLLVKMNAEPLLCRLDSLFSIIGFLFISDQVKLIEVADILMVDPDEQKDYLVNFIKNRDFSDKLLSKFDEGLEFNSNDVDALSFYSDFSVYSDLELTFVESLSRFSVNVKKSFRQFFYDFKLFGFKFHSHFEPKVDLKVDPSLLISTPRYPFVGSENLPFVFIPNKKWMNHLPIKIPFSISEYEHYGEDHRFEGKPVFPGAGYFEMVLNALDLLDVKGPFEFNNVRFKSVLDMDQWSMVYLEVSEIFDKQLIIEIKGYSSDNEQSVFMTCTVEKVDSIENRYVFDVAKDIEPSNPSDSIYSKYKSMGLYLGKSFRTLSRVEVKESIVLAEAEGEFSQSNFVDAGLLDGCMQLISMSHSLKSPVNYMLYPSGFGKLRFYKRLKGKIKIRFEFNRDAGNSRLVSGWFKVFSEDGRVVAECENYQAIVVNHTVSSSESLPSKNSEMNSDQRVEINMSKHQVFLKNYKSVNSRIRKKQIIDLVTSHVKRVLGYTDEEEISENEGLIELGLDSMMSLELRDKLVESIDSKTFSYIPSTIVFECPNIKSLSQYLQVELDSKIDSYTFEEIDNSNVVSEEVKSEGRESQSIRGEDSSKRKKFSGKELQDLEEKYFIDHLDQNPQSESGSSSNHSSRNGSDEPIAIVGMGCRFPGGSNSPKQFWEFLQKGESGISKMDGTRWNVDENYSSDPLEPGKMYTNRAGFFDQVDLKKMDREFFNVNLGEAKAMDPQLRLLLETSWEALEDASIVPSQLNGTKMSIFVGAMWDEYLELATKSGDPMIEMYMGTLASISALPGRMAYFYGVHGPNIQCDAACASSLMSTHLACQSLRLGETNLALAAGVNVLLSPENFIRMSKMQALSPTGESKPFDETANGYVRAEGCGVLVLKTLSDAERDGDEIYGLIRGSALSHAGRAASPTAPNGRAQVELLNQLYSDLEIDPREIDLIESHGTGTKLGDPIETNALNEIFKDYPRDSPRFLTSVKANIGHAESAAGVAGLMRVILSLKNRCVTKQPSFENLNSQIDLSTANIVIPDKSYSFDSLSLGRPFRAGVSAFGMTGMMSHIVLEEYQQEVPFAKRDLPSAKVFCLSARSEISLNLLIGEYKEFLTQNRASLSEVALSACLDREHFGRFRASFFFKDDEDFRKKLSDIRANKTSKTKDSAFLFSGQGSQFIKMGEDLYNTFTTFRSQFDEIDSYYKDLTGFSLREIVFEGSEDKLKNTRFTQPALFAIELSLFKTLEHIGISPDYVLGHSLGEISAACAAGCFSLKDGLRIISFRAELMANLEGDYGMVVVPLSGENLDNLLKRFNLSVAAYNSGKSTTLSGRQEVIEELVKYLSDQSVRHKVLDVSHGFHSEQMNEMLNPFLEKISNLAIEDPKIPLISNLYGRPILPGEMNAEYLVNLVRQPVNFYDGIKYILGQKVGAVLELGPGTGLLSIGMQATQDESDLLWLPMIRKSKAKVDLTFYESISKLYQFGFDVEWAAFFEGTPSQKVKLPQYPFNRSEAWFDETISRSKNSANDSEGPKKDQNLISNLCYDVQWNQLSFKEAYLSGSQDIDLESSLLSLNFSSGESQKIDATLRKSGFDVKSINLSKDGGLDEAAEQINKSKSVVLVTSVFNEQKIDLKSFNSTSNSQVLELSRVFGALIKVFKMAKENHSRVDKLVVISGQSGEELGLYQSFSHSLFKTFVAEYSEVNSKFISVDTNALSSQEYAFRVVRELSTNRFDNEILVNSEGCSVPRLKRIDLKSRPGDYKLDDKSSILITGGLSGLGYEFYQRLAKEKGVKSFVLVSRREPSDEVNKKIQEFQEIGVETFVLSADVTDLSSFREKLGQIQSKMKLPINGIIHSAGIVRDASIENQSENLFKMVFKPKLTGLANLLESFHGTDLEYICSFSSVASILSSPGQANYSASNSLIDYYNSAESTPRLISINWGPFSGTGMASKLVENGYFEQMGLKPISLESGFNILVASIEGQAKQVVTLDVDSKRFFAERPFGNSLSFFQDCFDVSALIQEPKEVNVVSARDERADNTHDERKEVSRSQIPTQVSGAKLDRSKIAKIVSTILAEIIGLDEDTEFEEDEAFSDLGLDSLGMSQFRIQLEKNIDSISKIPTTTLFEHNTLNKLVAQLHSIQEGADPLVEPKLEKVASKDVALKVNPQQKWAQIKKNPHAKVRLFCFPYAGAGANQYGDLQKLLGPEIEVYPIQLTGRWERVAEPTYTDVGELVTDLHRDIGALLDEKPFALLGCCYGGVIAYEWLKKIAHKKTIENFKHFFAVAANPPPVLPNWGVQNWEDEKLIDNYRLMFESIGHTELLEQDEFREIMLPAMRADMKAFEDYIFEDFEKFSQSISVYGAYDDDFAPYERLMKWRDLFSSEIEIKMFEGNHYFYFEKKKPILDDVISILSPRHKSKKAA